MTGILRCCTQAQRHGTHQHRHELLHREHAEGLLVGNGQELVQLAERIQLRCLIIVLAKLNHEPLRPASHEYTQNIKN